MAQVLQFTPVKRVKMKPKKSDQVPITKEMLYSVRSELSAKIAGQSVRTTNLARSLKSFENNVNARFDGVNARFIGIDARFERIEARLDGIDARLDGMDKRFDRIEVRLDKIETDMAELKSMIHSLHALVAEQTSHSRFVLDGYDQLYRRQEKLEDRQDKIETVVNTLILREKDKS